MLYSTVYSSKGLSSQKMKNAEKSLSVKDYLHAVFTFTCRTKVVVATEKGIYCKNMIVYKCTCLPTNNCLVMKSGKEYERLLACSFRLHLPDKSRCGYWKRYILQKHDCVQMYLPAFKQLPSYEKRKRIWKITCMQFSPSLAGQKSLWLLKKVYIAKTWLCTNVPARLQTIA